MMDGNAAMAATAKFLASSDRSPWWATLHKLRAETLVTWGRDDRVGPMDMALLPMRTIPKVEVHVFPNCGHWVMIEQKVAWESVVLAFRARPAAGR